MVRSKTPKPLWDVCSLYTTDVCYRLVGPLQQLHGRRSYDILTGNTRDTSEYIVYE